VRLSGRTLPLLLPWLGGIFRCWQRSRGWDHNVSNRSSRRLLDFRRSWLRYGIFILSVINNCALLEVGLASSMRAKTIDDVGEMLWVLQDEIRRSEEARYDHRLHGVLLVAQGMSAPKVAQFLGDGTRTVEYWVERFNAEGLSGLVEGERPGRPTRLSEAQFEHIGVILRESPRAHGMMGNLWDGKTLAEWLRRNWAVELSVRQCQRLFRQLGFRQRKPRPLIAHADPLRQEAHKKTSKVGRSARRRPLGSG
jgi:transposase